MTMKNTRYGAFIVTIKHENVKALDAEKFDANVVEEYRRLYWIIAIRNKSYQEEFYIEELKKHIDLLSDTEQILIKGVYGLETGNGMGFFKTYEKYLKKENISEKKAQMIFIRSIKKLKSILT